MKIQADQYNQIMAELRDTKAAIKAVESQLGGLHGRLNSILESLEDTNARISFQRRPKP